MGFKRKGPISCRSSLEMRLHRKCVCAPPCLSSYCCLVPREVTCIRRSMSMAWSTCKGIQTHTNKIGKCAPCTDFDNMQDNEGARRPARLVGGYVPLVHHARCRPRAISPSNLGNEVQPRLPLRATWKMVSIRGCEVQQRDRYHCTS